MRFSRWSKIWRMTLGSVMKETTRILPPQFLQINGSVLKEIVSYCTSCSGFGVRVVVSLLA